MRGLTVGLHPLARRAGVVLAGLALGVRTVELGLEARAAPLGTGLGWQEKASPLSSGAEPRPPAGLLIFPALQGQGGRAGQPPPSDTTRRQRAPGTLAQSSWVPPSWTPTLLPGGLAVPPSTPSHPETAHPAQPPALPQRLRPSRPRPPRVALAGWGRFPLIFDPRQARATSPPPQPRAIGPSQGAGQEERPRPQSGQDASWVMTKDPSPTR